MSPSPLFGMRFRRPPDLARAEHLSDVLIGSVASSCVRSNETRRSRLTRVRSQWRRSSRSERRPTLFPTSPSIFPSMTAASSAHSLARSLFTPPCSRCSSCWNAHVFDVLKADTVTPPAQEIQKLPSFLTLFIYSYILLFFFISICDCFEAGAERQHVHNRWSPRELFATRV